MLRAADLRGAELRGTMAKRRLLARRGEPKLWVHSAQRLGKLIDENWPLLQEIRRRPPHSMSELAGRTGRSLSNLSRTLKSLERCGLVSFEPDDLRKRPRVTYDRIELVTATFVDG